MLRAVNEPDKPVRRIDPPYDRNGVESTHTYGAVLLGLGLALCVGALIVEEGHPPWQVLGVFALVAISGLVMRIEAAIQRRSQ
jgi:hypothetical protein